MPAYKYTGLAISLGGMLGQRVWLDPGELGQRVWLDPGELGQRVWLDPGELGQRVWLDPGEQERLHAEMERGAVESWM